jgi:hypothetical protein
VAPLRVSAPAHGGSRYECLVTNTCIDAATGSHTASGKECQDLGTALVGGWAGQAFLLDDCAGAASNPVTCPQCFK